MCLTDEVSRALGSTEENLGLTVDELSAQLHVPRPLIRHAVSSLVFNVGTITCDRAGRFVLGSPESLLLMA